MFSQVMNDKMFMERLSVTDQEQLQFHEKSALGGVEKNSERIRFRLQGRMLERFLEKHKTLIDLMSKQKKIYADSFYFPYLIMTADHHGVIHYIDGVSKERADTLYNIGTGASLALQSAGTNAMSASILLRRPVCLSGDQHYLDIFRDWVTICIPIFTKLEEPATYLMFAGSKHISYILLYPFLKTLAHQIQHEMEKLLLDDNGWVMEESIERNLGHYKLSNREQEVAKYWLMDLDYRQISKIVGISENTVRVYIGKINSKMGVSSKASLILKVLGGV